LGVGPKGAILFYEINVVAKSKELKTGWSNTWRNKQSGGTFRGRLWPKKGCSVNNDDGDDDSHNTHLIIHNGEKFIFEIKLRQKARTETR
jgi:hypothetical protein